MGILTDDMKRVITEQRLGFVATICQDGSPNLSPKGTMTVLDDDTILFSNLRSPATIANLAANPAIEINFVDPLARKGYRFKGEAAYIARGTAVFDELLLHFEPWGDLTPNMQGIVKVAVMRALPITSPAYDVGATEAELKRHWLGHFESLAAAPAIE
ncbi:MAG: pyridoxamine 5'-phosphate oxidase family protein [Alphaproteobacteria bacterium]|nr:pyridoxamine 5'-phosphate oxidase family protein [Alphaproteobacteria bacterium]